MKYCIIVICVLSLLACGGSPMTEALVPSRDKTPPVLLDFYLEGAEGMVILFDEAVTADGETAAREPAGEILLAGGEEGELRLSFTPACQPGSLNTLYLDVSDEKGNTNWFLLEFYAPNANQPETVINEISPCGTSSRPDMVEFYVSSGGNTAGMSLLLGTENNWKSCYVFPDMDVNEGEYIIFHCRPTGEEGEVSETGTDWDLSTGKRSEEGIRDLWPEEDMNLSGTNGIISLMTLPLKGEIMDRLVYTNRTGEPDDKYKGWTSTLWPQIEELSAMEEGERGWAMEEDILYPEDGVYSDDSTSTRTLCRNSLSEDTDNCADWHTAPSGGCSFGFPNTDEEYTP